MTILVVAAFMSSPVAGEHVRRPADGGNGGQEFGRRHPPPHSVTVPGSPHGGVHIASKALASAPVPTERPGGRDPLVSLSYSKVRALTRVATPDNEAALLDMARAGTAAHLEHIVQAYRGALVVKALEYAKKAGDESSAEDSSTGSDTRSQRLADALYRLRR